MKGRCRVACVGSIGIALVWATASLGGSGPGGSTVTELVGRSLTDFPHFEYARAFPEGTTLEYAIDPTRFSSVQGATCTVYVVSSLTVAEWETLIAEESSYLPSLETRSTGSSTTCFPTQPPLDDIQDYRCSLTGSDTLSSQAEPCFVVNGEDVCIGLGNPNALVLDCDQDGELGPGDFIDGATDEAGFYAVHDTGFSRLETGCLDYGADGLPAGLSENFAQQRTYFPSNWDEVASCDTPDGPCATPLPLVVISHGVNHLYSAYDYLQEHLASYGYIVMSHQNDTITPLATTSTSTLEHTDVLLDILADEMNCAFRFEAASSCNGSATTAADLCALGEAGAVDPSRIVWIGHSRGGNGVVYAYDRLACLLDVVDSRDCFEPAHFDKHGIALLSTMAPIDRPANATPDMKPFHLFWTSADADVAGTPFFNEGEQLAFQMLDRARGHKQSVYIHGGAHGWFHENCAADPPENDQDCVPFQRNLISPSQEDVHSIVRRYYVPLLAKYVRDNVPAQDYFWRWTSFENLPAPVAQEHKLGVDPDRFVLDDYEMFHESLTMSSSGLDVSFSAELNPIEGEMEDTDCHFDWTRQTIQLEPPLPTCSDGAPCAGGGRNGM